MSNLRSFKQLRIFKIHSLNGIYKQVITNLAHNYLFTFCPFCKFNSLQFGCVSYFLDLFYVYEFLLVCIVCNIYMPGACGVWGFGSPGTKVVDHYVEVGHESRSSLQTQCFFFFFF